MADPRLRILQVSMADIAGGAEKVAWNLFRTYLARGHDTWLAVAKEAIEQVSPGALGGPSHPFYDTPKRDWYHDRYASRLHAQEARPLEHGEYLSGMNMIFRRSLLQDFGGFNPKLGMCGQSIAYGDETDALRRIRATMPGELIYYDPRLFVYHLVRPQKMSLRWIARQRFVDGRYSYLVSLRDGAAARWDQLVRAMARTLFAFGWDMIRGVFIRDRARYPYVENYPYEHAFAHLRRLGQLYEGFKRLPKESTVAGGAL